MISTVHTSCKDCIWAEYDEVTQIGCERKQLEKFLAHEVEVIEVYDEEKEFYVVNNRRCKCHRTQAWRDAVAKSEWTEDDELEAEMDLQYQAVIFSNDSIEDLKTTVDSISKQSVRPNHISVIIKNPLIKPTSIRDVLDSCGIPWKIKAVASAYSDNKALDELIMFCNSSFYSVFRAGCKVPNDTFEQLTKMVNDDLLQFPLIAPTKAGNGMVVPLQVHKALGGQGENGLRLKIETQCPDDAKHIKRITELCSNFPE